MASCAWRTFSIAAATRSGSAPGTAAATVAAAAVGDGSAAAVELDSNDVWSGCGGCEECFVMLVCALPIRAALSPSWRPVQLRATLAECCSANSTNAYRTPEPLSFEKRVATTTPTGEKNTRKKASLISGPRLPT
jgi:hypothetical protein